MNEKAAFIAEHHFIRMRAHEQVTDKVEAATGGSLQTYEPAEEDAMHWYGHHQAAVKEYEMYVFRSALVPDSYSPAALRPKKL